MSCISNNTQVPRKLLVTTCTIQDWMSGNQFKKLKGSIDWVIGWFQDDTNNTFPSHVSSGRDTELHGKVFQFSLKSLICKTVYFWEDLSMKVGSHARYPKALLEGSHNCCLAVCRLWHLKAVSRLMSPHEKLMKRLFPKRCRLRKQQKTLISHITAGKEKLKGVHKPHWHSGWAGLVFQVNSHLTLQRRTHFYVL